MNFSPPKQEGSRLSVIFLDGKTYLTAKFEAVSDIWGIFGWESCCFIPE